MKTKTTKENLNRCITCVNWNNRQAELDYSTHYGICTCFKHKFGISNYSDCAVLDRRNKTEKYMGINRFENQSESVPIGKADKSNYCFVTEETFGCINHKL